jgi:ABC-type multidrug transport system permease subunit
MVIASIHQPSTSTFQIFDKLLLLSEGTTIYYGPLDNVRQFFDFHGHPIPHYINPAEFLLDLVSSDFSSDLEEASSNVRRLHSDWASSDDNKRVLADVASVSETDLMSTAIQTKISANPATVLTALIHRSFIKSYRDVVAYGIRIAMYMGLAIMMGTVWLRLATTQANIQSFINAIFFGGAFMSFMAVAYIPAYLEDRAIYVKERANGLYGPTLFMISNFITGIPYLLLISLLFSIIAYWLCNFRPDGPAFGIWVMWLFLDLLAAESLVVFLSSLVPIFVVALAATAFANGLWMSVGGFMVAPDALNVFWRYVFHYIDYQAYVFQGMMVNEFAHRTYDCGDGCQCMYPSKLQDQCQIDGKAVLAAYGYPEGRTGRWVGYMILIIAGYRIFGWLTLYLRKT